MLGLYCAMYLDNSSLRPAFLASWTDSGGGLNGIFIGTAGKSFVCSDDQTI